MGGLILFTVLGIWFLIVLALTSWIAKKLPQRWWKIPLRILIFVVLLILPVIDEIVGGWQFKRLCEANADIQVDKEAAIGKTVYYQSQASIEIKGTWVHIVLQPWRFVDSITGEQIISYNTLLAGGGLFFKNFSQGGVPLLFNGTCVPKNRPGSVETFKAFGIKYIEPPVNKNEEL